jgi:hydrogenase maturation protease
MTPDKSKVLLLGLGNDILTDDGVGLHIVREIRGRLHGREDIDVIDTCEMGLSLLDMLIDYPCLVLVDAVQTHQAPPGSLHEVGLDDLTILPLMAPHYFGIGEIMALGRQLGLKVPECVRIFAVEVMDPFTVNTRMTAPLHQAMPHLVETVMDAVLTMAETEPLAAGMERLCVTRSSGFEIGSENTCHPVQV